MLSSGNQTGRSCKGNRLLQKRSPPYIQSATPWQLTRCGRQRAVAVCPGSLRLDALRCPQFQRLVQLAGRPRGRSSNWDRAPGEVLAGMRQMLQLEVTARGFVVAERRFRVREMQVHDPAGSVVSGRPGACRRARGSRTSGARCHQSGSTRRGSAGGSAGSKRVLIECAQECRRAEMPLMQGPHLSAFGGCARILFPCERTDPGTAGQATCLKSHRPACPPCA
jgi:hypothetical protein